MNTPEPTAPPRPRVSRPTVSRSTMVAGAAVVVVLLAFTAVLFSHWGSDSRAAATPTKRPTVSPSPTRPPTTAEIYQTLAPSVVSIDALAANGAGGFSGTGVVVNANATILTALHVVQGAASIRVTFADDTVADATVLAADPALDIAVLQPTTMPGLVVPAVLGGRLGVGDNVIAIGNPLGLTRTVTTGVVSGLDRAATTPTGKLTGLIQFDAAVNPGSSGGPLLNSTGAIVGIVVALANPTDSDTFIGIGFAVPIGAAVGAGGADRAPQQ